LEEYKQKVDSHEKQLKKHTEKIVEIERRQQQDKKDIDMKLQSMENKYDRLENKVDRYGMEQIGLLKDVINHNQTMETTIHSHNHKMDEKKTKHRHEIVVKTLSYVGGVGVALWVLVQFALGIN
jgi:hypothetical protein